MTTSEIDVLIVQAALAANALGILGLGFAGTAFIFVGALCVYTTGNGVYDSLTAFGTNTLPQGEEVAEFYVRVGIVNTIAALIGGPLWSALFGLVIRNGVLPLGLPFWMCAGCFGVGVLGARSLKRWRMGDIEGRRYDRVGDAVDES